MPVAEFELASKDKADAPFTFCLTLQLETFDSSKMAESPLISKTVALTAFVTLNVQYFLV